MYALLGWKRWIVFSCIILLGSSYHTASLAKVTLPDIGANSQTHSAQDDQIRGEAIMRRIRQGLPIIEDPEIEDYIWNLGYRLVAHSDYKTKTFRFFVVNDSTINAFAGPAGNIGVNAGLILTAENESELAAVIAHEIAHVTQRHLERAFDAAEKLSLPTAAALIAAIILSGQNVNIAEAALAATIAANLQTQINFTRTHEQEADHIGMQVLAQSRFNPNSMATFFERLQQADRLFDTSVPEFLRTHPVTNTRISEARDRAEAYKFTPTPDNFLFYLTRAKLRTITTDDPTKLVRRIEAEMHEGNYKNKFAQIYGYGHALLKANKISQAHQQIKRLIALDRERIPYLILLANIEIAANNSQEGLRIYEDALKLNPYNIALTYRYAETLLRIGKAIEARKTLYTLKNQRISPIYYELLAKAEGDAGHPGLAHQALAEYYFLNGYTRNAIEQLNLALREKDINAIEMNRIEERIKQLKELLILEKQL